MTHLLQQDHSFGIIPILPQGKETTFLLIQHRAGHWGFPKGHAEPGETALATACRELEEETGITHYRPLATPSWQERYSTQKKGVPLDKQVTYFLAIVQDEHVTIQTKEIQAYSWDTFEAALNRITYPTSRDLLIQVQHYLTSPASPLV
ncbi:bis(5'-nucleosyl)-tetraphosphatase [Trichothermofontia sp.]